MLPDADDTSVALDATLTWSWDATVMLRRDSQWRRNPHLDATLAWDSKVALRVSGRGCPLNANIVLDMCLLRSSLRFPSWIKAI